MYASQKFLHFMQTMSSQISHDRMWHLIEKKGVSVMGLYLYIKETQGVMMILSQKRPGLKSIQFAMANLALTIFKI